MIAGLTRSVPDIVYEGRTQIADIAYGGRTQIADIAYGGHRQVADISYGGHRQIADIAYGGQRPVADIAYGGRRQIAGLTHLLGKLEHVTAHLLHVMPGPVTSQRSRHSGHVTAVTSQRSRHSGHVTAGGTRCEEGRKDGWGGEEAESRRVRLGWSEKRQEAKRKGSRKTEGG
eukprot:85558-Rhodomonas_salina.1